MKSLFKLFLFGMFIIFSNSNIYAQPPKDVKGFDNFQIGMTVDQIIKMYDGTIERRQKTESTDIELVIPSYKVGKLNLEVSFHTNKNKELFRIGMYFDKELYLSGDNINIEELYTDFKKTVFEKYGTGDCHDNLLLPLSVCEWFFPSSEVRLTFFKGLETIKPNILFSIESKEKVLETERNLREGYDLELLEGYDAEHKFTLNSEGTDWEGYIIVTGQVKNISEKALKNVQAMSTWYDVSKPNRIISYETALIEFNPLLPGQISPFKIIADYKTGMGSYGFIEFKFLGGAKIPTYDKLNLFTGKKW